MKIPLPKVEKHYIVYWVSVFLAGAFVFWVGTTFINWLKWKETGSRFTGEDAIWLLDNSNIEIRNNGIEGIATPFRDYIRSRN
jgi:hypothetical protein